MAHEKTGEIRADQTPGGEAACFDPTIRAGTDDGWKPGAALAPEDDVARFDRDLTKQAADAAASRLRRRGS
jgi:hypothetical protein